MLFYDVVFQMLHGNELTCNSHMCVWRVLHVHAVLVAYDRQQVTTFLQESTNQGIILKFNINTDNII
jgi:hypothetical protein